MTGILGKGLLAILVAFKLTGMGGGGDGSHAQFYAPGATPPPPEHMLPVAILPFDNLSEDPTADRKILGALVTYLLSTGACEVSDPGAVEQALYDAGARGPVAPSEARTIAQKLGVRALLMGSITQHGASRSGAETVPVVALDARLIDVVNGRIVWAASISETGASGKLFGAGRIKPLSVVSQTAVARMVINIFQNREAILERLGQTTPTGADAALTKGGDQRQSLPTPGMPETSLVFDKGPWAPGILEALAAPVKGFKRGETIHSEPFHKRAVTHYTNEQVDVEVEIVDYETPEVAENVVAHLSAEGERNTFFNLPSFSWTSDFGFYHRNVIAGRVGILTRGNAAAQKAIDALVTQLLSRLQEENGS